MGKYLTEEGLTHFWTVVKAWIVTQLSSNAAKRSSDAAERLMMKGARSTSLSAGDLVATRGHGGRQLTIQLRRCSRVGLLHCIEVEQGTPGTVI